MSSQQPTMTKPLIKGEQLHSTPEELFKSIVQNNLLARVKDGEVKEHAHQACKSAIEEIIKRDYGVISMTFEAMFSEGTGIGCEACIDAFKYAQAQIDCRSGTLDEIEKKYGTHTTGCAVTKDGIAYIDPKQHCPG